jgi:hypothetical protein
MKQVDLNRIRQIVSKIKIAHKDTTEGKVQREAFRIRWGIRPEDVENSGR